VPSRTATTFVLLLVTAVVGSAISLRRVVKVDPAAAIG
jgi:ABC-type antimicrobial peptide transport system permease subunit